MKGSNDDGVSPVIAVILLVALAIVLSATAYVMVMSYGGGTGIAPFGTFTRVQTEEDGSYSIIIGPASRAVRAEECRLSVNGFSSDPLSQYLSESNPFRAHDGTFQFYIMTLAGNQVLSSGSSINLRAAAGLGELDMTVHLLHIPTGGVIASTSFLAQGSASPDWSLDGATAYGSPSPSTGYPIVLSAAQKQYISNPKINAGPVVDSISIEMRFMLRAAPHLQSPWASLINNDGNSGIRLQLSGTTDGNDHLEFGMGNNWIRSDGKSDGVKVPAQKDIRVKADLWYTAKIVYDTTSKKMQLYMNDTDSNVLVLTGQKTNVLALSIPQNSRDWYIGAWGSTFGSRWFDGTISYIIFKAT